MMFWSLLRRGTAVLYWQWERRKISGKEKYLVHTREVKRRRNRRKIYRLRRNINGDTDNRQASWIKSNLPFWRSDNAMEAEICNSWKSSRIYCSRFWGLSQLVINRQSYFRAKYKVARGGFRSFRIHWRSAFGKDCHAKWTLGAVQPQINSMANVKNVIQSQRLQILHTGRWRQCNLSVYNIENDYTIAIQFDKFQLMKSSPFNPQLCSI